MSGYCGVDKDSDEEGARAVSLNNSCLSPASLLIVILNIVSCLRKQEI